MKNKVILVTVYCICSLLACQQETIDSYKMNESKVYFQVQSFTGSNGAAGYSTQTSFSFVDRGLEWTSVVFKGTVQLLGEVKDYDRQVRVVVDQENTTMNSNGYELNLDTLYIRAGMSKGQIGVRFLRTLAIREKEDTLVLRLEPNEHFNVLETYKSSNDWTNTTAGNIDGARYMFIISEIYTCPNYWSNVTSYFGEWNATRYVFINDLFGFTSNDWLWAPSGKVSPGRLGFYARELQKELQTRADEGNPVIDEDGSYMQLPDAYHVDYSNVIVKP